MKEKYKVRIAIAGAAVGIILGIKYLFPVLLPFFYWVDTGRSSESCCRAYCGNESREKTAFEKKYCRDSSDPAFYSIVYLGSPLGHAEYFGKAGRLYTALS